MAPANYLETREKAEILALEGFQAGDKTTGCAIPGPGGH
jgi:hypothetical protein